jgi:hypothetical protein
VKDGVARIRIFQGANMSNSAKSIFVWGVYLIGLGGLLLLAPNSLLPLFGFPPTNEIWIHILGVVVTALGYYHIQAARREFVPFFLWSTQGRVFTVLCFTAFIVLGLAKPALFLFASADFFGAFWTGLALRSMK